MLPLFTRRHLAARNIKLCRALCSYPQTALAAYKQYRSSQKPRACPRYALGTNFLSHPGDDPVSLLKLQVPDLMPDSNFSDLVDANGTNPPDYGSIVEFYDPVTLDHCLGVVVQPAQALFHRSHSMAIVLTLDNNLVRVSPVDMTFHAWRVFDSVWLLSLEILENRFNSAHTGRALLVAALKQFATECVRLSDSLAPQLERTHAQLAAESSIRPVLMMEIIDLIELAPRTISAILDGYMAQCTLIYGLHVALTASPLYISSSMFPSSCNLIAHHSTNTCVSINTYYTLSMRNCSAYAQFFKAVAHPQLFENMDSFTKEQLLNPHASLYDASVFFNIWDGKPYRYIIAVLKAMVVFPHPAIMTALHRLTVFSDIPHLRPHHLYDYLVDIGVYSKSHASSNPLLSADMVGESLTSTLQVSTYSQIQPTQWPLTSLRDHFAHLRRRKYYRDQTIYGIDGLGLSLEKINARKYRVNVHVPCFALHISPSSALFTHLAADGMLDTMISDVNDLPSTELPNFDDFKLCSPQYKLCLTFSLEYPTFDNNPFAHAESKVDVSLDDISAVNFKHLSPDQFKKCIAGDKPTLAFSLFRASADRLKSTGLSEDEVSSEDIRAFGFIYSCLKTHFRIRLSRNSLELAPALTDSSDTSAKLFFQDELCKFTNMLAGVYCNAHSIPVLAHSQTMIRRDTSHANDVAWVVHDNPLVPDFQTQLLDQTLIARGLDGYASASAYFASRQFMHQEQLGVNGGNHATHGLEHGRVDVTLFLYGSMLNQLQILSHLQARASNELATRKQVAVEFGFLKRAGYNVNGAYDIETIAGESSKISASKETIRFLSGKSRRYRVLRAIEKDLADGREIEYECVVVHVGITIDEDKPVLRAYCTELDIEVTVLHNDGVGSVLRCNALFVDVISDEVVMQVCSR